MRRKAQGVRIEKDTVPVSTLNPACRAVALYSEGGNLKILYAACT